MGSVRKARWACALILRVLKQTVDDLSLPLLDGRGGSNGHILKPTGVPIRMLARGLSEKG